MIFTGHAELTIDAKQRLAIPAKHRAGLTAERDGTAWYSFPSGKGKITLYTEKRFIEVAEKGDFTLTPTEAESQRASAFFGMCERIEPDSANRIVIPRMHKSISQLGDEVVMVGCGKYLEIWDKSLWEAQLANFQDPSAVMKQITSREAKP
jgi:MraZ protein